MRTTILCWLSLAAACAPSSPAPQAVAPVPAGLHCEATPGAPPVPVAPRTPEAITEWAVATEEARVATARRLDMCRAKLEVAVHLLQERPQIAPR